jgi:tetratricopeptide (TPR) repeat protein
MAPDTKSVSGASSSPGILPILVVVLSILVGPTRSLKAQSLSSTLAPDSSSILSDPWLLDRADAGLEALYNLEDERADSLFSLVSSRYQGHPIGPFLSGLRIWWRILPNLEAGEQADDRQFLDAMDRVIESSDALLKKNENSFDAMFFKGAALGFRGRLLSNRRRWLEAAKDGRETLDYIFRIAAADTTNADFQFGKGVYDYFASVIPRDYPIVRPMMFFFPKADRERGLRELEFTATDGRFIQTEAVYFLLQISLFYESDFLRAIRYSSWLRERYPDNAWFHALQGRVYAKWSQFKRSAVIFRDVIARYESGKRGYTAALAAQATYYVGRFEMNNGNFQQALDLFDRADGLSGPGVENAVTINSMLRRGMIHDILGERLLALDAYGKVLQMEDRAGLHKRARAYRKRPYGSKQ